MRIAYVSNPCRPESTLMKKSRGKETVWMPVMKITDIPILEIGF